MSLLKRLVGETGIYGLSSIVGRALNYLLVPLYTQVFAEGSYGIVSELYAYAGFLMVILLYRIETAFFRFGSQAEHRKNAFSTGLISILLTTIVFSAVLLLFIPQIAEMLKFREEHRLFLIFFVFIIGFDVLNEIPFAKLRLEGRAVRFASIKLSNIFINIGLNLFFLLLCPYLLEQSNNEAYLSFIEKIYHPEFGIGYVFVSNLVASAVTTLLLIPEMIKSSWIFDKALYRRMLNYALPLVIVGLAGIVNEMLDRVLLKQLLPYSLAENEAQLGIYSACYKLAMLLALFTQAFRYAAEPFFFNHAKNKQAPILYAKIAKYFFIAGLLGFLAVTLYIDYFQLLLRRPGYREGLHVVPILLIANLFLGLYYNLSVWYKLTDKTIMATYIAIGGAAITILLNIWWIPRIGYVGSAWATLICYASMCTVSYFLGKKYYSLPYEWIRFGLYFLLAIGGYYLAKMIESSFDLTLLVKTGINTLIILCFLTVTFMLEKKDLKATLLIK